MYKLDFILWTEWGMMHVPVSVTTKSNYDMSSLLFKRGWEKFTYLKFP